MLGNAGETELDLRFRLMGIPVRVHPLFWLTAVFISWEPHRPDLILIGVLCVFASILVHELGHAVMFRRYGHRGEIVLYMLGGFATGGRLSTWRNVIVSAAGPLAGFLLAGIVFCAAVGIAMIAPETYDSNRNLRYAISTLIFINIAWGILNLVPCLPLDGGRIAEALIYRYLPRRADIKILWTSIISSGAVALLGVRIGDRFLMILFGLMCAQHIIMLNHRNSFR